MLEGDTTTTAHRPGSSVGAGAEPIDSLPAMTVPLITNQFS
jgi:hypothetical protein